MHDFALDEIVGRKRMRKSDPSPSSSEIMQPTKGVKKCKTAKTDSKANRQDAVLKAIALDTVTERHILDTVGDNRYTREILRRLVALEVVQRLGCGGPSDPFEYRFLRTPEEAEALGMVDPAQQLRCERIESKILAFLSLQEDFILERQIRLNVGDNTGTGSALRRLVSDGRVLRAGRGGSANPFTYRLAAETQATPDATTAAMVCEAPAVGEAAQREEDAMVSEVDLVGLWSQDLSDDAYASEADTADAASVHECSDDDAAGDSDEESAADHDASTTDDEALCFMAAEEDAFLEEHVAAAMHDFLISEPEAHSMEAEEELGAAATGVVLDMDMAVSDMCLDAVTRFMSV